MLRCAEIAIRIEQTIEQGLVVEAGTKCEGCELRVCLIERQVVDCSSRFDDQSGVRVGEKTSQL